VTAKKTPQATIETFAALFAGRTDARGDMDGGCIREVVDLDTYRRHLDGEESLGLYSTQDGNRVVWACTDHDGGDGDLDDALRVRDALTLAGATAYVERSREKGYHVWVFFAEPVAAAWVRVLLGNALERAGLPSTTERFPKQDRLEDTTEGLGNYLNLPYCGPCADGRRAMLDPKTSAPLSLRAFLKLAQRSDPNAITLDGAKAPGPTPVPGSAEGGADGGSGLVRAAEATCPYWTEGRRHALGLGLCGAAAKVGLPLAWAQQLISRLVAECGDDNDRKDCSRDTYRRLLKGQTVKGYTALTELLPREAADTIMDALKAAHAPDTMRQVDAIRLEKGGSHVKSRNASEAIEAGLRESGKLFHTADESPTFYYQDAESREVVDLRGGDFAGLIVRRFGVNPAEKLFPYLRHYLEAVVRTEPPVPVYRSYLFTDDGVLYIHAGPGLVLALNGETIESERNGDNVLFVGSGLGLKSTPKPRGGDCIKRIAGDVSFDAGLISERHQRVLFEYMVRALPFLDRIPVRPIPVFVGTKGSGKTLAQRRILKMYLGPDADVSTLETRRDAEVAAANTYAMALDNLDDAPRWVNDWMATTSTGVRIPRRELYTNNQQEVLSPKCWLLVNARTPNSYARSLTLAGALSGWAPGWQA